MKSQLEKRIIFKQVYFPFFSIHRKSVHYGSQTNYMAWILLTIETNRSSESSCLVLSHLPQLEERKKHFGRARIEPRFLALQATSLTTWTWLIAQLQLKLTKFQSQPYFSFTSLGNPEIINNQLNKHWFICFSFSFQFLIHHLSKAMLGNPSGTGIKS